MFKERTEGYVPSWDGTSKSWRRYVKEISWYVGSTKRNQRQYIASKLISRLSGSARLLAMSWSQREFEGEEGVALLLRRFAASPLVRRSLPNAAAIMSEYFSFKRKLGEGISQFLVRETLGFEEFSEALAQLKEERDGVDPSTRVFDLPPMSPTDERSGYTDHRTGWPSGNLLEHLMLNHQPILKLKKVMQKSPSEIQTVHRVKMVAHLVTKILRFLVSLGHWTLSYWMFCEVGDFLSQLL